MKPVVFQAVLDDGVIVPLYHRALAVKIALSAFKPGAILEVHVGLPKTIRTTEQNNRMWWLMKAFVELGWEKDEAKDWCCKEFLDPVERVFPNGTRTETVRGTSGLDTKAMGEFQDRIERFLNEKGIYLPAREDHEYKSK